MKLVNADMLHLISGGDDSESNETVIQTSAGNFAVEIDVTYETDTLNGTDVLTPTHIEVEFHQI